MDSEEAVQDVESRDERPRVPKRLEGMSDGMFEKLADRAYESAAANKAFNDSIRRRVYFYQDQGVLTVIEDAFAGSDEIESLYLIAELINEMADKETPTDAIEEPLQSRIEKPRRKTNGRF